MQCVFCWLEMKERKTRYGDNSGASEWWCGLLLWVDCALEMGNTRACRETEEAQERPRVAGAQTSRWIGKKYEPRNKQ